MIEMLDTLIPQEDSDATSELRKSFARRGIVVHLGKQCTKVEDTGAALDVHFGEGETTECDLMLVSVGRAPLVEGIGLEAAGVAFDPRTGIETDAHRRTSVPHIYAAGDVAGYWQLAHTAFREGEIAAENATGHEVEMPDAAVPRPIYTDPEIAGVGLTEAQAVEQLRRRERRHRQVPVGRERARGHVGRGRRLGQDDPRVELRRARRRRDRRRARDRSHRGRCRRARRGVDDRDDRGRHGGASDARRGTRRSPVRSRSAGRSTFRHGAGSRALRYPATMKIYTRRNAAVGYLDAQGGAARDRQEARAVAGGAVSRSPRTSGSGSSRQASSPRVLAVALRRRQGDAAEARGLRGRQRDRRRVRHRAGARPRHVSDAPARDDASLIRPALDGLVPYEPGKPVEEVQRELGLERVVKLASNEGPYGPFPEAQEAIARATLELNRYPDGGAWRLRSALAERHDVALRAGDRLRRCRRGRRVRLPGDARPGRRGRHGVAVVPELRARPAEARRRPRPRPARGRADRPRRAARRDHAAHEARLHRRAEQPDRDDERPRGARRVLRAGSAARPHGPRPGVLRVRRRSRLPGRDRRVPRRAVTACSSCGRSRRSSASPGCASATASGRRTSSRRSARCGARSTSPRPARRPRLRASTTSDEIARRRAANRDAMSLLHDVLREHRLEPAGPAVANFLFVRVGDALAAERRAPPSRRHRPSARARSARPTRSASRPERRTRSRSSATRSPTLSAVVGALRVRAAS